MTPSPAEILFQYLAITDEPRAADIIIGFGHFDMEIPRQCGRLYQAGFARHILLAGGIGAGTADLGQPEGIAFREELRRTFPGIPDAHVTVEYASTNTGENVTRSAALLRAADAEFCFERGIRRVIAVASPYRQRRVMLTLNQLYPDIEVINVPPVSSYEAQRALFTGKEQSLDALLAGEIERLVKYALLGYIREEPLPSEISFAYRTLKIQLEGEGID